MAAEPLLDLGVLVSGVVVHNHVNMLIRRGHIFDYPLELQPFLIAVAVVAQGTGKSPGH